MTIREMGERSKAASYLLQKLSQTQKNDCLKVCADALKASSARILSANEEDIRYAKDKGMPDSLIDRLKLTHERIDQMADGLMDLTGQKDPVGEIISSTVRPNGLEICQKRVPIGTIGIIYESRPNVTADAFGLCFKTANTVILKGGSDAINSNQAIVEVLREAISSCGIPEDVLQLVSSTDRSTAMEMMRLNGLIDVLIPRGGAGLIRSVVENATVPVIETGTGNCHIYVDEDADLSKALPVIINAKTQRTGVCNACESLIFHEAIAADMLPQIAEALFKKGCVLVGDERSRSILPEIEAATEEDWGTEYLDLKASVKIVSDLSEAIAHINQYNTGHSESIITENYTHARRFLDEIDAACVYVNASTRFTDGGEFGFGAEIGISTQKLHARGPMGLVALTTTKYVIFGDGQIRG